MKVTFTVRAKLPGPPLVRQTLKYQWQRRGPGLTNFVNIVEATNDTFTIDKVSTNDVAYYRVTVTGSYYTNATTTSEPAQLLVWTKNSPFNVYGSPVLASGSKGSCPGGYAGYVFYNNGADWGWVADHPSFKTHKATDNSSTGTTVEAYGYCDDGPCDTQEVRLSHTDPIPPCPNGDKEDPKYQFTIYFPSGTSVPTSAYPITLTGFIETP